MLLCSTSLHIVKPTLSVFRTIEIDFTRKPGKIQENPGKTGQKPAKTGEILGTVFCDRPEQLLLMDFFDYLKKTFPADSGRSSLE